MSGPRRRRWVSNDGKKYDAETGDLNNPADIGPLGVDGVVVKTEDLSDLIQEAGRLTFVPGLHSISSRTGTLES